MPELVLGPVLRYVGIDAATVDGRRVWPPPDHPFRQPAIRTLDGRGPFRVAFGSCRVALPYRPPYTLAKDEHPDGREFDALFTLARELLGRPREDWPDLLLMLGDQVYVDEGSPAARRRIRATRDTSAPPGQEVASFEEYTWLYHESWGDPVIRWLLSTIPTAMVLDDHDMADDWNISGSWKEEMNRRPCSRPSRSLPLPPAGSPGSPLAASSTATIAASAWKSSRCRPSVVAMAFPA